MPKYRVIYYIKNGDSWVEHDRENYAQFHQARDMAIAYTQFRNQPALVLDNETGEILYG